MYKMNSVTFQYQAGLISHRKHDRVPKLMKLSSNLKFIFCVIMKFLQYLQFILLQHSSLQIHPRQLFSSNNEYLMRAQPLTGFFYESCNGYVLLIRWGRGGDQANCNFFWMCSEKFYKEKLRFKQ